MKAIKAVFGDYLSKNNLRSTTQRDLILDVFQMVKRHITTEELYNLVRSRDASIGWATVHRTLKLLCDAGVAREVDFGDGVLRFEPQLTGGHHDHLICNNCGEAFEVVDQEIERLQEKLARKHGFVVMSHRMDIFGLCRKCKKGG